ncbi:MAG: potassium channel family protein, partial [Actinomycetes bacterium]
YQRRTSYPMFVIGMVFLVAMVVTLDPVSPESVRAAAGVVLTVIWVVFVADYIIGYYLSSHRRHYVKTHLLQLVGILFPPLRVLLLGHVFVIMTKDAKKKLGGRVRVYALYLTTMVLVVASIAEYGFESRASNSNIRTLVDSFWWSTETVSTVGYGDFYPVTTGGRVIAVILFINGIALLSAVTATIATKVLEGDIDGEDDEPDVSLIELRDRLQEIERHIAALTAATVASAAGDSAGVRAGGDEDVSG